MASYVMSMMNKHDLAKYAEYMEQGFVSLQGMEFEVILGEDLDTLEGEAPGSSVVLMKFPDKQAAMRWYRSEAYQKAIPIRHAAADTVFAVHFTDDQ